MNGDNINEPNEKPATDPHYQQTNQSIPNITTPKSVDDEILLKGYRDNKNSIDSFSIIKEEDKQDEYTIYNKLDFLQKEYESFMTEQSHILINDFNVIRSNFLKNFSQESDDDKQNRRRRNQKIKRIDQIISLINVIKNSIQTNFDLLHELSISSTEIIKNTKTTKQFIGENIDKILNSWLIIQMDSDQLSNIKQSTKVPQNIKNYILQDHKKALKHLKINEGEYDKDDLIKINKANLQKLSLCSIHPSLLPSLLIYDGNKKMFPNISKVEIKGCNIEKVKLDEYFPEIQSLKITLSRINYSLITRFKFQRLTNLCLDKINLTNSEWIKFRTGLIQNRQMRTQLEVLSLSNNKLSVFSLVDPNEQLKIEKESLNEYTLLQSCNTFTSGNSSKEDDRSNSVLSRSITQKNNKKKYFLNLKIINLENNRLSMFNINNYNVVDNIKVLNLISNNISFMSELSQLQNRTNKKDSKTAQTYILLQKNNYLFKPIQRDEYIEYMVGVLSTFDYQLKNVSFDYMLYHYNKHLLNTITFSPKIQDSLNVLSLSSCSLENKDVIQLIKRNEFSRLRKLNLSWNLIDENILKEGKNEDNDNIQRSSHLQYKYAFESLIKLEKINLAGNKIKGDIETIEMLKAFLKSNSNIKKMYFYSTPIEEAMNGIVKAIKSKEKNKLPENSNNDKDKEIDLNTQIKILRDSLIGLEQKDFTNQNYNAFLKFLFYCEEINSDLKLYFSTNMRPSNALKYQGALKNIKFKKLNEKEIILPE